MTKEELRKSLDFVNEERERLQRELERKDNIINEIKKMIETLDFMFKFQTGGSHPKIKELKDKIKELEESK